MSRFVTWMPFESTSCTSCITRVVMAIFRTCKRRAAERAREKGKGARVTAEPCFSPANRQAPVCALTGTWVTFVKERTDRCSLRTMRSSSSTYIWFEADRLGTDSSKGCPLRIFSAAAMTRCSMAPITF